MYKLVQCCWNYCENKSGVFFETQLGYWGYSAMSRPAVEPRVMVNASPTCSPSRYTVTGTNHSTVLFI